MQKMYKTDPCTLYSTVQDPSHAFFPFLFARALQELMMPVECLMPAEIMSQNHEGQRIIYELESVLVNTKKLFLDTRVTKSIIDLMSSALQVLSQNMFCHATNVL